MDGESCCFIGHKKVKDAGLVIERVKAIVIELLLQG